MTRVNKREVSEFLKRDRQHTIVVRGTSIQIKLLLKGFHIIVKSGGEKPLTYVYRDKAIAIDRFCEQANHFGRDK